MLSAAREALAWKEPSLIQPITCRPSLWRCEECGRQFANRNQVHSCARHDLEHHFAGKPALIRQLYDAFVGRVQAVGPVIILPQKTRIAFQVRMSFAALMPKRNWIDGHLVLAERYEHPLFRRVQSFSPRNHLHEFRIDSPADLSASFQRMIELAYAVGQQQHLRRRVG